MRDKILKALVKQLLKLFVPVVGSLVVDLAAEGTSAFIDARIKAKADDLIARLDKRLADDLRTIGEAGEASFNADAVLATVGALVADRASVEHAWSAGGFNPECAARAVLDSGKELLRGLSEDETLFCARALTSAFRALDRERGALEATEAAFRRSVIARLDELTSAIPNKAPNARDAIAAAVLAIPTRPFVPAISAPGALLRADIDRPVPFHGRTSELDDLLGWAASGPPLRVRLITGAGGMGKTRLMFEACRQLRMSGWTSGFLDPAAMLERGGLWDMLAAAGSRCLMVIDYAENRRDQTVDAIGAALRGLGSGGPVVRLVLLARAADDWWEELRGERGGVGEVIAGPACDRVALRALASRQEERAASYNLASRHFAAILGTEISGDPPADFADRIFERALLLHMAALSAVEGVSVQGDQGILGHALDRERRFWRERAEAAGLDPLYEKTLLQGMAVLTLAGGAGDRTAAIGLLRRLPSLRDASNVIVDAIAQLLHEVYSGELWIDPVLPDLLGEHLVQVALEDGGDGLLDVVLGGTGR